MMLSADRHFFATRGVVDRRAHGVVVSVERHCTTSSIN